MTHTDQDPLTCYLVGLGHTGSTLLDLIISSHSRVTTVGEAKKLLSYTSEDLPLGSKEIVDRRCTCGVDPLPACPFWTDVDRALRRHELRLAQLDLQNPDDEVFRAHNRAFFRAVAEVSGAKVVVDSSKSAVRLQRLGSVAGLPLAPIHVVRSAPGTVGSFVKRGMSLGRAVSKYNRFTWVAVRTIGHRPAATVSLETLAEDPERVLRPLMSYLGLDFEAEQLDWGAGTHHNIHGNEMRFTENPELRRPSNGRADLTGLQWGVARAGCAPFELVARRREQRFLAGTVKA